MAQTSVVSARIAEPCRNKVAQMVTAAGMTESSLIASLYASIAKTGVIPEECRSDTYCETNMFDTYLSLLKTDGAHEQERDLTPEEMREVLYGAD